MSEFLRWILGLRQAPEWADAGSSWHLQLNSLPQGPWAVLYVALAIACVVGVYYLYKSEVSTVGPRLRLLLVTVRTLVLTCVALMLLELVLVVTKREEIPSRLIMLVDTSQSMGLNDPYADDAAQSQLARKLELDDVTALRSQPRLELARRALAQIRDELADGREVAVYGFADESAAMTPDELASAAPGGSETAIGAALAAALAEHRGQPLAGILLASDGNSNAGEDPRKVAEQAGSEGVPIVSLAVATLEGPSNARLGAIEADPVVFAKDETTINVLVEGHGLKDRTGSVVLERREDAVWNEVGREEITFDSDKSSKRASFRITPEKIGEMDFRARIEDVGTELTEADNVAAHSMKVVRQQIRVLLIAGSPSFEVQFLRNALLRDTGLEFACWLQTAGSGYEQMGTHPIRRLPVNREELEHYDVIILFDPDMKELGPAWPNLLTQFVGTAGGGLVYVAGELHTRNLFNGVVTGPADESGSTVDNSWLRMLPVAADSGLYRSNVEVSLSAQQPFNLELTMEGSLDQVFQFDVDPARNREVLASLPGMYWHFPVTRAKPGATVLARHGDPRMRNAHGRHVLFAMHRYGPGRTVFVGFDATYRWRYLHEEYFDGFWARLIDRVGRNKALGGRYPFTLVTDRADYRTGDQVTIRARAADSGDGSAIVADLRGELELAGQPPQPIEMTPVPNQLGVAEYSFTANETGVYSVRVLPGNVAASGDAAVRPATLNIRVEPATSELDRPKLDRALLEDVARASEGGVFSLVDYEQVPDAFDVKQVGRQLEYRDELWDAPIIFGSLMLLLTLEWVLRKRARMA
ncbi:MAG: VWA domain-containing protein [Planctomycetota bacterium]|nr:MAG: VWA domain-containing protein [Planctomycetota bacterium]